MIMPAVKTTITITMTSINVKGFFPGAGGAPASVAAAGDGAVPRFSLTSVSMSLRISDTLCTSTKKQISDISEMTAIKNSMFQNEGLKPAGENGH
jgi:hypothetical protein